MHHVSAGTLALGAAPLSLADVVRVARQHPDLRIFGGIDIKN